jgi:hypothetical protein
MEAQSCVLGLLILFIGLTTEASSFMASSDKPQTIYDALQMNGLPKGLLPNAVKNFTVDEQGNFEVHLDKPCYAKFENQVYYEKIVKGNLSYGQIGGLSGIVAQELFLWFPVKGIRVDIPSSGLIYFDVGVVYKQWSLSLFENPPDCKDNGVQAGPQLMEGKIISEMLTKTLSGRFRYESDNAPGKAIQ